MLKSNKERQKFIENEENWNLITDQSDHYMKVYEMHLPNGVTIVRTVYQTCLEKDNILDCFEYRLIEGGEGISTPLRQSQLLDYLRSIKVKSEEASA